MKTVKIVTVSKSPRYQFLKTVKKIIARMISRIFYKILEILESYPIERE